MRPGDIHGKKILYGCLDWGSGHISRSIPLIAQLAEQGNTIIIWCSEKQEAIFRQFDLAVDYHNGFDHDFHFKGDGNFFLEILRNTVRFSYNLRKERKAVKRFVSKERIDLVVSDHRYGMRAGNAQVVFVTHQTQLPEKSGSVANKIHHFLIRRFEKIWIMDNEEHRLGGNLSSPYRNSIYIGHYSRFSLHIIPPEKKYKYVAVISGPEEYAVKFYKEVLSIAAKNPSLWAIVCPPSVADPSSEVLHFYDWKSGDEAILNAATIVSRSGYSTLMDLLVLNCDALLIPTPGQLEQEYLKDYLGSRIKKWDFMNELKVLQ